MQVSENDIIFIVIISTTVLFMASATLVTYVRMYNDRKKKHFEEKKSMTDEFDRQLMQLQLETQEATMGFLSKELHDNVGQLLNSTKLLIGIAERRLKDPPDTLITAGETLGRAIQELRSLSKSLDKDWLAQFDFLDNLDSEVARMNAASNLLLHFTKPDSLPLNANEQIILFRIAQEIIQNAIKHANATNLYIVISNARGSLKLTIRDDGSGFDEQTTAKGLGIRNIKHRTHLLGGNVGWEAIPGQGTTVTIELPVNQTNP